MKQRNHWFGYHGLRNPKLKELKKSHNSKRSLEDYLRDVHISPTTRLDASHTLDPGCPSQSRNLDKASDPSSMDVH
jgi:hypothetical protein